MRMDRRSFLQRLGLATAAVAVGGIKYFDMHCPRKVGELYLPEFYADLLRIPDWEPLTAYHIGDVVRATDFPRSEMTGLYLVTGGGISSTANLQKLKVLGQLDSMVKLQTLNESVTTLS